MHSGILDNTLIVASGLCDASLCAVFLRKSRIRNYPALLAFVVADLISSPLFYLLRSSANFKLYTQVYMAYAIASFLLQLAILYEVARHVLRPNEKWTREALKRVFLVGTLGALMALLATLLIQPEGRPSPDINQLRADVFTGLLTCELVIAMMLASGRVGLGWRNHVMAIGQGLMVWALVSSTAEGAAAYLGPQSPYLNAFYLCRVFAYLGVVSYWCISLWHEEPARKPISPAFRKYVLALHETVHYDLGKVGH